MHGEEQLEHDPFDPNVIAAREELGKAVSKYLSILRPTESPIPVAWIVAAEWTNMELEQSGRAGRDVVSPPEQTLSTSAGLGMYIADRYT